MICRRCSKMTAGRRLLCPDCVDRKLTPAQQRLVEGAIAFAWKEAHRFADRMIRCRSHLSKAELVEDLAGAAMGGLVKAAQRFESKRGYQFLTYAGWYVLQALQDESRHFHPLGPSFMPRTGGRSRQQYRRAIPVGVHRLDEPGFDVPQDESETSLDEPGADAIALLRGLPARLKRVMRLRFVDGLTLRDTAAEIGVSKERVRQLEKMALKRLRKRGIAA